jgi:hypothetical protein
MAQDDAEWQESKHPRAANGQFGHGGGSSAGSEGGSGSSGSENEAGKAAKALKADGFTYNNSKTSTSQYAMSKGDLTAHIDFDAGGGWDVSKNGTVIKSGKGADNLKAFLDGGAKIEPPAPTAPKEGGAAKINSLVEFGKAQGFEPDPDKSAEEFTVFTKGASELAIDYDTGDWTLKSPGHMTKTGNGQEALKALLEGGPSDWQKAGVKNGQMALMEQVAKKQAAALPPDAPEHLKTLKKIAAVRPNPTSAQSEAISSYKGSGYVSMNNQLRKEGKHTTKTAAMHEWLEDAALPEDVTLYRGVKADYAAVLHSIVDTGTIFRDRGFISTTTANGFAENWKNGNEHGLLMTIRAKKGQKGAAIRSADQSDGESEVVLQSDSRLKVVEFDWAKRTMVCELIQEGVEMEKPKGFASTKPGRQGA